MKKNNAKSGRKVFSNKGNSPTPQEINSVMILVNEGRFAEAVPLAQAMTMRFPLHGFSWTALGTVFMNMGRIADALAPMQKAAALLPDNPDMHNNLSIVLRNLGRLDEAEQFLRKAVLLGPESIEYRFNLANFLATSNRSEDVDEAKSIYLEVIKVEPTHLEAWNNMGHLLFETGYTSAARTAYSAAVTYHPREAIAHVNLGSVLLDMGDLSAAEKHFKIALNLNPDLANAHQGLACIFQRRGNEDESCHHRDMGFGKQPLSTLPYRGRGKPIQLLVLGSALEGNIPWRFLIDCDVFQTTLMAVEYFDSQLPLPSHQLIINAIGDADLCQGGLEIANRLIKKSQAPVINRPDAVLQTGRLMNAQRLGILPGVVAPRMALVSKTDILSGQTFKMLAHKEFTFPLLLRSPGFQGGNYFVYVDGPDELNSAVEELPGENLLAIEFIDSRSQDHLFRKYRVMSINGSFYPIHLAISAHWKVHYVTSDMSNNAKYRNEEDAFLNDFSAFLDPTAITALKRIEQSLGLDYCGIDFGMDKNENILLYEANSTMVFNPPTHEKQWDYKRAAIENALTATKRMFVERVTIN